MGIQDVSRAEHLQFGCLCFWVSQASSTDTFQDNFRLTNVIGGVELPIILLAKTRSPTKSNCASLPLNDMLHAREWFHKHDAAQRLRAPHSEHMMIQISSCLWNFSAIKKNVRSRTSSEPWREAMLKSSWSILLFFILLQWNLYSGKLPDLDFLVKLSALTRGLRNRIHFTQGTGVSHRYASALSGRGYIRLTHV